MLNEQRTPEMNDEMAAAKQPPPPPETSITPEASATTPAAIDHHIKTLQRLDREYDNLLSAEKNVENYLHQLQKEEASLRLALEQSSTSLKDQREKEAKKKEEEAVARLEEALMMDAGSSSDNYSSSDGAGEETKML